MTDHRQFLIDLDTEDSEAIQQCLEQYKQALAMMVDSLVYESTSSFDEHAEVVDAEFFNDEINDENLDTYHFDCHGNCMTLKTFDSYLQEWHEVVLEERHFLCIQSAEELIIDELNNAISAYHGQTYSLETSIALSNRIQQVIRIMFAACIMDDYRFDFRDDKDSYGFTLEVEIQGDFTTFDCEAEIIQKPTQSQVQTNFNFEETKKPGNQLSEMPAELAACFENGL